MAEAIVFVAILGFVAGLCLLLGLMDVRGRLFALEQQARKTGRLPTAEPIDPEDDWTRHGEGWKRGVRPDEEHMEEDS